MSKPQKKKVNSRWAPGGQRYDEKTAELIGRRYREQSGWHQAARVRRNGNVG